MGEALRFVAVRSWGRELESRESAEASQATSIGFQTYWNTPLVDFRGIVDSELEDEKPEPFWQKWANAIGLVVFALNLWVFHVLLRWLHVSEIEELTYPRFNAEGDEIKSDLTLAGIYAVIISAMVAYRLSRLLETRSMRYHLDDPLAWNTWAIALTVFIVFVYAIPDTVPALGLLFPVIAFAVGWTAYRVYKRMTRRCG